jgi:hypothetical protein
MDPITTVVMALVTGAATALQPTTAQVVKNTYASFKGIIQRKYEKVNIDVLEADPASKSRQMVIREDLDKTDAGSDIELLKSAKLVLESIQIYTPSIVETVGVDLRDVKGAMLEIEYIVATGSSSTGVRLERGEFRGDIKIGNVTVESREDKKKPQKLS